jgi:hypothetical protein
LLGNELRRCRFQFDDDREQAVAELVLMAEALEPALPPPPPPVEIDDEGYPVEGVEGGNNDFEGDNHQEQAAAQGGDGGGDSDEEVPWYSNHFTITE